ncbi:MAG: pimeloyl-ACP methyl ester esterase BioH [Sulfuricella sp.]|nr:pimeloyl-ACP methyl ester esterase BioH [Sulfuricella sp.]
MHIETIGSGPNLVLIHGWGMHGGVWGGVRDALARRFCLHIVDLPGYGASPALPAQDLESVAHAVAGALPDSFHVCGWSLGGLVAQELALTFPGRIERLVLTGATPCFTMREDWSSAVPREMLLEFAAALETDYEGTSKRFLALQARGDDAVKPVLKRLRETLFARGRPDGETLRAGLRILLESDLRARLAALKAPALLVQGERDLLTPPAAARWVAGQTGARLEIVRGAAHAVFLPHPELFVETITGFLHD